MDRINPFYKSIVVLIWGVVLSFSYSISVNVFVFGLCLLILFFSKANKRLMFKLFGIALVTACSLFFTGLWFTNGETPTFSTGTSLALAISNSNSFYNGLQLGTRIMAFAGVGILFTLTTNPYEFVSSLIHQAKLSPKYGYGVLAALNMVGTISSEYKKTKLAFKVRGMGSGFLGYRPLFTMLVNSLHYSTDLAMAMESKGFDGDEERTYYLVPKVTNLDKAFLVLGILLILVLVFLI